ncbi:hypothetical protein [Streptosporangium sp. NPDC006930]|uniref:hypothetical protein n=1 Tax=Streptosporangium sp. NPDC006930 TaxID=3154783 RepID=UPI00341F2F2F
MINNFSRQLRRKMFLFAFLGALAMLAAITLAGVGFSFPKGTQLIAFICLSSVALSALAFMTALASFAFTGKFRSALHRSADEQEETAVWRLSGKLLLIKISFSFLAFSAVLLALAVVLNTWS